MRSAAALAIALLPLAAAAQGLPAPGFAAMAACSAASWDAGGCDPAAAALEIDTDLIPLVRPLHEARMESFAVAYVLRLIGQAIDNRLEDGDCVFADEALTEADAVWSGYVERPAGLGGDAAAVFDMVDGFVTNATAWLGEGGC